MNDMSGFENNLANSTGLSKVKTILLSSIGGGIGVTIVLLLAVKVLPEAWSPASVAGKAAGQTEVAEMREKLPTKVVFDSTTTQIGTGNVEEIEDNRQQQQTIYEANQGAVTIANIADALCFGSIFVAALGTQNTGADVHEDAKDVGSASCGMGDAIRGTVLNRQVQTGRNGGVMQARVIPGQSIPDNTRGGGNRLNVSAGN
jgi:hypothetical protein